MDIYFIRHGQSSNNDLFQKTGGRLGRKADPELTDLGQLQAARLAAFVTAHPDEFGFTHIYSSLMARAIQTAIPMAEGLHLPIIGQIDAHESGGIYLEDEANGAMIGQPGRNRMELQKLYGNLILPDQLNGNGWWNRGFETPEERPIRAKRLVDALIKVHGNTNDRVAVISHYGFFNHLVWAFIGLDRPQGSWFVMNNTAISRFSFDAEGTSILYLNRVDHLQPEQISE
jgi:2,3-bisphosphoglycerate-dependent phosphoglycerate mutase